MRIKAPIQFYTFKFKTKNICAMDVWCKGRGSAVEVQTTNNQQPTATATDLTLLASLLFIVGWSKIAYFTNLGGIHSPARGINITLKWVFRDVTDIQMDIANL